MLRSIFFIAMFLAIGITAKADNLPAFKPVSIVGTILCREYDDLIDVADGLKESLDKGRATLMRYHRMRDEVGLPLCGSVTQAVTFTLAPHIEKLEGLHSLKGVVDSYVVPVLYRRAYDGAVTTGYILSNKPVRAGAPQGDPT